VKKTKATLSGSPNVSLIARILSLALALTSLLCGGSPVLASLIPDIRNVPVAVEMSGSSLSVRIPAGAASCVLEVKQVNSQRWFRWRTLLPAGRPTLNSVAIPKSLQGAEWRATASVSAQRAATFAKGNKFPEAYYQGNSRFSRTPAAGHESGYIASVPLATGISGNTPISQVADRLLSSPLTVTTTKTAGNNPSANTTATPSQGAVEADIWKTQGNTVFFFNQLRGLQVLDLADPAVPRMQACLRLPAVGQDLYVLSAENSSEALVLLLTRSFQEGEASTEVLSVRVSGSTAQIVAKSQLSGWLADSRMVGGRLYVLTSDWTAAGPGTALQEFEVLTDGTQSVTQGFKLTNAGGGGLISAGSDWLAVSYNGRDDWMRSNVALFGVDEAGASLLAETPIRCAGQIYDKFKVSLENNTLTVVSQRYDMSPDENQWRRWEPVTLVENFDSGGNAVSKPLEVIRGENLYASRFVPGKLYLVTAVQSDPLWVVDLKDPALPAVLGHVEVPGFSTYIEPVGEDGTLLFTIGLEEGKVAASLFDVSDVTKPALKSRVYVSEMGSGYSEAVYDEKALKVLPEDGLVLVPFSGWRQGVQQGEKSSFVRLLDLSLVDGGSLVLRGRLDHAFAPRRAMLLDGVLTSISQKELVTADITNRDKPAVLAEVGLAWPVNQILRQDQYLLQIGDGSNAGWTGETASLRVTKAASPDTVLSDIDLGEGSVQDATLKAGRLYVLRKKWGSPEEPLPYQIMGSSVVPRRAGASELILDVYDTSALPQLKLLGSAASKADPGTVTAKIGSLLWISDTIVGVVCQPRIWSFGWEPMALFVKEALGAIRTTLAGPTSEGVSAKMAVVDALPHFPKPRSERSQPAVVRAFDVSNPAAPVALSPLTLTGTQATMLTTTAGGDGLLVFGYGEAPAVWKNGKWPQDREQPVTCVHRMGIADFGTPSKPVLRAPVVLPGRLFAATEVSRTGILAFTESVSTTSASDSPQREVKVSTVSHPTVTEFATRKVGLKGFVAAEGRALFVAEETVVQRAVLNELGLWLEAAPMPLPFQPRDITVKDQQLLGVSGDQLLRASWKDNSAGVDHWQARIWVPAARLLSGDARTVYAPQGDFGVEQYVPAEPSIFPITGALPPTGSTLLVGPSSVGSIATTQLLISVGTSQANTSGANLTVTGNNTYSSVAGVSGNVGLISLTGGTLRLVGSNVTTQVLISSGTSQTNPEGYTLNVGGLITSSGGTTAVLGTSGSIYLTGGTISTVTSGTLSLVGSNVTTQVLISSGTIQTNPEWYTPNVGGLTISSGGAIPTLGASGTILVTGGTISTNLGEQSR
jgi:uncharacterized secreted protein with C-terminal beta-propeller domain